jgi:excisionase family DNA binding protein
MDEYLTIRQAAERLQVNPGALLRKVQRTPSLGIKVGWQWVIHEDTVKKLLEGKKK